MSALDTKDLPPGEDQSGGLRQHLRLKLELAAVIRSAMQLLHEAKDARREQEARRLLSRLAEDRFNLVVVGQFKRGKSSLMNAVLGMDRLPTGVLPLTSVITTVRYGDRECVLVQRRGSALPQEVALAQLEEYVTEKGNPGNRKQVALAEVRLPSEVLRLGFHFIDTPGVGSAIVANTVTRHSFLPEGDAVVFVTSFESTMNEGELAFLRTVARHVHKIFFVVNKVDLVSAEDRECVLASVRQTVAAQLGIAQPRVFAVSAREGLEAKLAGNREMLARSGLPELESALTEFLTAERTRVSLLRCIERTIALLAPERVESRASEVRAGLSSEAAWSMKREWDRRIHQIETECLHTVEAFRCRIRSELPSRFEHAIAEQCTEVRDSLAAQVDVLLGRPEMLSTAQDLRELAERADAVAGERLRQWLSIHQAEFVEALWALAAEGVDRLERLYSEGLGFANELFGLPPPGASWGISTDEAAFPWTAATPFEWRPRFAWELDLLSAKWMRRRVRRHYCRTLEAAAAAYRDRVTQAVAEAGSAWAGHLSSEVKDALRDLHSRVANAIEGQAASGVSGQAVTLLTRLDATRQELTDKSHSEPAASAPILGGERRAIRPCFVCERIGAELFDFFSKRQYELATNEAQQRAHAASGGFCSLHTWQYERIASPQGVCLAYAPLLAAVARHLRSVAASSSSLRSMRERIRDLYPSADKCPACQRTAEAERMAVEQVREMFVHREEGAAEDGLCIPHLGAVLGRETDLETARSLLLEQARTLDRISEDMQTCSLKRDALRRELVGEEEWMAHLLGLSRLVGNRRLSAV
jgi:GTP-binding protein EngB required for normal cell division